MHLFLNLLQLCYIAKIIKITNGYVLLAANLDDFKSVAKKFVPERLADQLTKLASNVKYRQESTETDSHASHTSDNDYSKQLSNTDVSATKEEEPKKVFLIKKSAKTTAKEPDINIDDLVEKVKERLERDFNIAIQNNKRENYESEEKIDNTKPNIKNNQIKEGQKNKKLKINSQGPKHKPKKYENTDIGKTEAKKNEYDDSKFDYADVFERTEEAVTNKVRYQITERDRKPTYQKIKETHYDEDEASYDHIAYDLTTTPKNQFFDGIDLAKSRDSYDDYVTPKKEDFYESEKESKTQEKLKDHAKSIIKKNSFKVMAAFSSQSTEKETKKDDYDDTENFEEEEVKARTESLWFDDSIVNSTDGAYQKSPNIIKSGTMIPTRQFYKMSSPNYYAKLPVVAQKYNFNEPLPEKDREPEKSKPVADPSVNINGKVRLYK